MTKNACLIIGPGLGSLGALGATSLKLHVLVEMFLRWSERDEGKKGRKEDFPD
jgi:hypothetical protein